MKLFHQVWTLVNIALFGAPLLVSSFISPTRSSSSNRGRGFGSTSTTALRLGIFSLNKYLHPIRAREEAHKTKPIGKNTTAASETATTTNHTHTSSSEDPFADGGAAQPDPIIELKRRKLLRSYYYQRYYNYREFQPQGRGPVSYLRWLVSGDSSVAPGVQSAEKMRENLSCLARLLILLRYYRAEYGMPQSGGRPVQKSVIADLTRELYNSGAPTWVLEPVMERVAEGLNGRKGVQFSVFPRQTFIFYPSSRTSTSGTDMIKLQPGFHMSRLGAVEQVAVRLASFASNTGSVERLSGSAFRVPDIGELSHAESVETAKMKLRHNKPNAETLAKEILNLASETYGLFYFLNTPQFQEAVHAAGDSEFWQVEDSTRELFTRLAADEASKALTKIQTDHKELYGTFASNLCRFFSSAGASAMWFGGSVPDMLVAGLLAVMVGYIGKSQTLAFEERILTEVVASFAVGLTAGLLSIRWPNTFCFGAMAVASLLDLMQGFKMVFSVIEIMSKNLVTGTARLLEGLLFTGLISHNIRFGLVTAVRLMHGFNTPMPKDVSPFLQAFHEIGKIWYLLLLPLASFAWSGLFRPSYVDLPLMMFHGTLAFSLNMLGVPSFAAAMCVTFSAGIISRFTGREALGNTLAGLYALVPGAYMVRGMLAATTSSFLETVVTESVAIGLGGWTGTILCSPTVLGKSSGLHGWSYISKSKKPNTLFYF